jgi:hypothetical protein
MLILFISGTLSINQGLSAVVTQSDKLDFIFVLHANQALVPYGDVANDLNYHEVIATLLDHPTLPITLHISGTLISILQFFSPDTIDLIKSGISSGQFEILGSTYSQNVMYSQYDPSGNNQEDGDYDNLVQMELHKEILQDAFGITPKSFWNPERVWDPDLLLPIIKQMGYESTFIEDTTIAASTATPEHLVRTTGDVNDPFYIYSDDHDLIFDYVNTEVGPVDAIAIGPQGGDNPLTYTQDKIQDLMTYLDRVYDSDTNDEKVVTYAQDMEAWGLWQEEGRMDGSGDWSDSLENVVSRLDDMLTAFEGESPWLKLVHPSTQINDLKSVNYVFSHEDRIEFGEANWMNAGAKSSGFQSWKDWQDNDNNLKSYRTSFSVARNMLREAEMLIDESSNQGNIPFANTVLQYMKFVYSANQFEFGCWGCNFYWWHRTQTVGIGLETIKWILSPPQTTETKSQDLDNDQILEFLLYNNHAMYIFSQEGGRLIGWFDLDLQDIIIYNDAPASYMEEGSNNWHKYQREISGFWGRSLKTFHLRQKALNDYPINTITDALPRSGYSSHSGSNSLRLSFSNTEVSLSKNMTLNENNSHLDVIYKVENKRSTDIPFSVTNYYSVSNLDLLFDGNKNLEFKKSSDDIVFGVQNSKKNIIAGIIGSDKLVSSEGISDGLFAYGVQYNFEYISENSEKEFLFKLAASNDLENFGLDATPPAITINLPTVGSKVSGVIEFDVVATDDFGISKIQLLFNGKIIQERASSGVLQFYDSTLPTGTYTWTIRAYDTNGNFNDREIELQYTNPDNNNSEQDFSISFMPIAVSLVFVTIVRVKRRINLLT